MAKVRKLTGNFIDMLKAIYPLSNTMYPSEEALVKEYTTLSSELSTQLLKDLNRDQFFPTNGRTIEEYVAHWMSPSTSAAYNQGNGTGAIFMLMLQLYILKSPRFTERKAAEGLPERTEILAYFASRKNISLCYFDDEGISCGISIDYSTLDPNLWSVSIIRNTTAEPKDRDVLLLSSEELLDQKENGLTDTNNAQKATIDFMNSKALSQQLMSSALFTQNGALNLAHVQKLYDQFHTGSYPYSTAIVTRLMAQEQKIKKWQLSEPDLKIVKTALNEKRKENIDQLDKWYSTWFHKPSLDTAGKQPFLRRNSGSIFGAIAALATLVGFALVLSGVLAPLGVALVGSELIFGAVGAGLAFATLLATTLNVGRNERNLASYQSELTGMKPAREKIYQERLTNITTLKEIEQLPEEEALQVDKFQTQLLQAVLHANFSEEEFKELDGKMPKAAQASLPVIDQVNDIDRELVDEQSLLIEALFEEQIQLVKEIGTKDEPLDRIVDRTIQQSEYVITQEEHQADELTADVSPTLEQQTNTNNVITVH
ncbi:hypothetical protein ACD661_07760 [Legionella lytica]|uniref:Substrate of the Dot/Icm secretion system n=1 Tax=Legionella lytica TaxID=96232 RepID=A0ABW8D6X3_9GAMM